jgi:phospho-N-acetylmuramoyl-pentapeptide-transferase
MLYWLSAFSDTIGPLNVLRHITFRTGGAMITALALVAVFGPGVMRRREQGQAIPDGLTMLLPLVLATLLWANPGNYYVWIAMGVTLGFGAIGCCRGYVGGNDGADFSNQIRIVVTASIALTACLVLVALGRRPTATSLGLPSGKELVVDLGWFYVLVGAFTIVAAGNVANLADRLYGRVIGPLLIAALSFSLIAWLAGNAMLAEYFDIHHVPGTGELAVLCGAAMGAGLGFLWLDAPHASTRARDAASLALGGLIGTVAVATKHEIVLALFCCLLVRNPSPAQT